MAVLRPGRLGGGFLPILLVAVLLLVSLYLLAAATRNSEEFGRLYIALLVVNLISAVALVVLIGSNLARLVRQYRAGVVGSRLTMRLLAIFVVLALIPVGVVYTFSLDFISRGIDSWFTVRFERAFDDALELSRLSLDDRKREYLRRTRQVAGTVAFLPRAQASVALNELRDQNDAHEFVLIGASGRVIAFSGSDAVAVVPSMPPESVVRQVRQGTDYVGLDPVDEALFIRIVLAVPVSDPAGEGRLLQAMYPVSAELNALADSVEEAASSYQQLAYLRAPLKSSFVLTLSLILLLSLLAALWAAFYSARRLVAPIRVLALGTRAVASGDYDRQLPQHSSDEMGFLVQSFNDMTRRLARARDQALGSRQQAEGERAYLRAVLGRLSSGVLTLDRRRVVRTANHAAGQILGVDLRPYIGKPFALLGNDHPYLLGFLDALRPHLATDEDWRRELVLDGPAGRRILMCGGTSLSAADHERGGRVLVFEDVTALVQAQRDAAWGEVARRLAHEIKNPLTPIRLSAERLRHKYLRGDGLADPEILERSTYTIVRQVEVMEEMVKAFSEYARTPRLRPRRLDLHALIEEVLDLYRGEATHVRFETRFDADLPPLHADAGRIRQLLHNLIKNAIEATASGAGECRVMITTVLEDGRMVVLRVQDNGPGLPPEMLGRSFEPYVTTKRKGTGLGLAIVKKIVEEHGGTIAVENAAGGGAVVVMQFPLDAVLRDGEEPAERDEGAPGGGDAANA